MRRLNDLLQTLYGYVVGPFYEGAARKRREIVVKNDEDAYVAEIERLAGQTFDLYQRRILREYYRGER